MYAMYLYIWCEFCVTSQKTVKLSEIDIGSEELVTKAEEFKRNL